MSYTINHWILINGGIEEVAWAHTLATQIFPPEQVSAVLRAAINYGGYLSVAPDGSKEGWDVSDDFDRRRAEFMASLLVGRLLHDHVMSWTVFGLGEDGEGPSIMEYHDPLFYALLEGEPVHEYHNLTLAHALTPLDILVPGRENERWRGCVKARVAAMSDAATGLVEIVSAETMVLAKLLDAPDKYGAIGTPDKLSTGARAFYDELLADAHHAFPGAHASVRFR
jgi:hypothetical protein